MLVQYAFTSQYFFCRANTSAILTVLPLSNIVEKDACFLLACLVCPSDHSLTLVNIFKLQCICKMLLRFNIKCIENEICRICSSFTEAHKFFRNIMFYGEKLFAIHFIDVTVFQT